MRDYASTPPSCRVGCRRGSGNNGRTSDSTGNLPERYQRVSLQRHATVPWAELRPRRQQKALKVVKFTVPGAIKAKARHRSFAFKRNDGSLGTTSYADKPTEQYEAFVALCAMNAGIEMKTYTGPVSLFATFRFSIPNSRKKKLQDGNAYTQRPDLDNCQKSLLDGLNRIAWYDDSQVTMLSSKKVWTHGEPGVDVEINYLED